MRLGYLMKYGLSRKSVFACSAKKKKKPLFTFCF